MNWKVINVHFLLVYKEEYVSDLIKTIKEDIDNNIIFNYVPLIKEKCFCKECGKKIRSSKYSEDFLCSQCTQKIKKKMIVDERLKLLNDSNIDFSQKKWTSKVGELFGVSPQQACRWVKEFLPDVYERKCFKYETNKGTCSICGKPIKIRGKSIHASCKLKLEKEKIDEERKQKIMSSLAEIKIGTCGWITRLSNLLNLDRHNVKKFVEMNLPSLL